jgi:hypothetical protein
MVGPNTTAVLSISPFAAPSFPPFHPSACTCNRSQFLKSKECKPSTIQNYYRAVILLLRWMVKSTGAVTALGGHVPHVQQQMTLERAMGAWEDLRTFQIKAAKRASAELNRLENIEENDQWTDVPSMFAALRRIVEPRLKRLMDQHQQTPLGWDEKCEYFELMMCALVIRKPVRPCTFYAAYVLVLICPTAF